MCQRARSSPPGYSAFGRQLERRLCFARALKSSISGSIGWPYGRYRELDLSAAEQAPVARQKSGEDVTDDLDEQPAVGGTEVALAWR